VKSADRFDTKSVGMYEQVSLSVCTAISGTKNLMQNLLIKAMKSIENPEGDRNL
jgi:hypothetical protein